MATGTCDWCGKASPKPLCNDCVGAVAKFVKPKPKR
jgi:hypothetical protein